MRAALGALALAACAPVPAGPPPMANEDAPIDLSAGACDATRAQRQATAGAARMHLQGAVEHQHGIEPGAVALQLARLFQRSQLRLDTLGDAMAVHVPVPHHVAQETALVGGLQTPPQGLAQRTDAIHHALPRQALRDGVTGVATQRAQRLPHWHARQRLRIETGRTTVRVRQRQQCMPRQHVDAPAVPGIGQRHHAVGHAQARADDGQVAVAGQQAHAVVIPRVDHLARGQRVGTGDRQRAHAVAAGQHHLACLPDLATGERQLLRGGAGLQRGNRVMHDAELRGAAGLRLLQACLQVRGIAAARGVFGGYRVARQAGERVHLQQVVQEIIGRIGQRAHLAGRHIQQVLGPRRGVGDALGQHRGRLEHGDMQRSGGRAQRMQRYQHARRTAADDGQVTLARGLGCRHAPIVGDARGGPCRPSPQRYISASASRAMPSRLRRQVGRLRQLFSSSWRDCSR